MAKPLALIEPLLLRRLGTLGKLQPTVRHGMEEQYLAAIARAVMPDATVEEIEGAKAEWRAEARLEQIRSAESSLDRMQPTVSAEPSTQLKSKLRRTVKQQSDVELEKVKSRIRKLRKDGYTHAEICGDLGRAARPRNVEWRDLLWLEALMHPKYKPSVKSWISRA